MSNDKQQEVQSTQNKQSVHVTVKQQVLESISNLPGQYKVLVEEMDNHFNKIANLGNGYVLDINQIALFAQTLFALDKADYTGMLVGGKATTDSYKVPEFLEFMVLPERFDLTKSVSKPELVKRYYDIEVTSVMMPYQWDEFITRLAIIVSRQKSDLKMTTKIISALRTKSSEFSDLLLNSLDSNGYIRDFDVPCLYEIVDGIDVTIFDSYRNVPRKHYIQRKLSV